MSRANRQTSGNGEGPEGEDKNTLDSTRGIPSDSEIAPPAPLCGVPGTPRRAPTIAHKTERIGKNKRRGMVGEPPK
eukprot:1713865-Pyramimonas_sp.AAC.1